MTTTTIEKSAETARSNATRRAKDKKSSSNLSAKLKAPPHRKRKSPQEQPPAVARVTKHALLLQLLNSTDGTTITDMMQATGWQQHSVRGFLVGTVKKKLGLALTSSKVDGEHRRYRIAPSRRGR